MQISNVEINKLEIDKINLSDVFFQNCNFCNKIVRTDIKESKACIKLSGEKFSCTSCLRNYHNYRSENILLLSFKSIIAYYYYKFYMSNKSKWLFYLNDLKDFIKKHKNIGLNNPVFSYDSETYLWFINFNRVGEGKVSIEEVINTLKKIHNVFEIEIYLNEQCANIIWQKFDKAVRTFYKTKKRPKFKKILIPTMAGSVEPDESPEFYNITRNFTKLNLILK